MRMTQEALRFFIDTKREIEFSYQGKQYNITYGTDESGGNYILFGETYMGTRYYSFAELMTCAKIQNHYFREMLSVL